MEGIVRRPGRIDSLSLLAATLLAALLAGCNSGSSSTPPPVLSVEFPNGSAATLQQGHFVSITANVVNDTSGKGVTWSFSGVGSLSKQTTSSVEYDAPLSV